MKLLFSVVPLVLAALGGCAFDGSEPLILDRAWWTMVDTLQVSLWAPQDGPFELEMAEGRVAGVPLCHHGRCVATFTPARAPERVLYLGGGGGAATVHPCGEDRLGLCPFGETCVDGACVPLCDRAHPDGACVEDGAVCLGGWCTYVGGDC